MIFKLRIRVVIMSLRRKNCVMLVRFW